LALSAPKESLEVILCAARAGTSLNTGSAAVNGHFRRWVGSAPLFHHSANSRGALVMAKMPSCAWLGRARRPFPHELVGCVAGLLCCGLRCVLGSAFLGTEVFRQVIQEGVAIGVGDDCAQAFHFVEFVGPLLAGHVMLGDAAGVMAGSAGGFHFRLQGSGRQRLAWGGGRLRARQNDGCEQKDCGKNSLDQAGSLSQFSVLRVGCVSCFVVAIFSL
jgi:hypothetical protein